MKELCFWTDSFRCFIWTDSQSDEFWESRIGGEQFGKCQTRHLTWKPFETHRKCMINFFNFLLLSESLLSSFTATICLKEPNYKTNRILNATAGHTHNINFITYETARLCTKAHTPEEIHWWNVVCETLQPLKVLHTPTAQKESEFKCAVFLLYVLLFVCLMYQVSSVGYSVTNTMLFSVIVTCNI